MRYQTGQCSGSPQAGDASATPWVLVAGGFHRHGGMDRCNWALARYLVARGDVVHLVCHTAEPGLAQAVAAVHRVPKPAGSFMLGGLLLARSGRKVASQVTTASPRARVVVNGGNCDWPDINWVHYVHAAWSEGSPAPLWLKAKSRLSSWLFQRNERSALRSARIVIANSERTRRDLIELLKIEPARVHTVYLGCDAKFSPGPPAPQTVVPLLKNDLVARPLVVFVGALGYDSRKGFDVLFSAWIRLCSRPDWDADLAVAGDGRALTFWRHRTAEVGLQHRIAWLGFVEHVPELLATADLLVSPVRYEPYGLNVHEAICCGIPALVSWTAGVAERYPAELQELLIEDPENVEELTAKLLAWRRQAAWWKEKAVRFSEKLRRRTFELMARDIVEIALSN